MNYQQSELLSWALEDSNLLLEKVAASGKEKLEEVDFEGIFEESFQGKCTDSRHLRRRFMTILNHSHHYYKLPSRKEVGLQSAMAAVLERREMVGKQRQENSDKKFLEIKYNADLV